jgi:hypothetical protein
MKDIGHGRPLASTNGSGLPDTVLLEAISRHVRPEWIDDALRQTGRQTCRTRKLPAPAVVWLVIAIGLWGDLDIPSLWRQVIGTLRSLWCVAAGQPPPGKSALSQARTRLGPRSMRRLFVQTAGVIATARTRGAFYRGKRLMLMDGQKLLVPDTPANAQAFGRPSTRRYGKAIQGGYPQIHTIRLVEAGTHLTVEALIKPARSHEYPAAPALLKKARPGDLVLWDRGFYGYSLLKQARDEQKDVLGRVPAHVVFERIQTLPDGSYLARIYPTHKDRRQGTRAMVVRVIEYTFDDPQRPGHGQRHRLVTTLLDAQQYPAQELVVLYHQRWEIEIDNDELATHQLARPVDLRSRTPCGVVQELYGILLAHNAVRALMHESALAVNVDPLQLSFIHAVRVIRETIPLLRAARTEQLPRLYEAMIAHIGKGRLPPRDNRINPRVVKIKMSNFKKKRPEDYRVSHPQRSFAESVVMLK